MASIPFTLAALATSAVPGLRVTGVRRHESDESFACAIISTDDHELIVRVPRTQAAEVQQSAELLGLAALTEGSRSQLPFAVPETRGMTRAGDTRAVVSTLLPGERFETADLSDDARLLQPIAETIGAIHDLPVSVAQQGGLPVRSAQDLRLLTTRLIDRAERTRMLPETVLRRWQQTVGAADVWDFTPTMVHGSLDSDRLRVLDDRITGVLGWSELSIGDPACDLAWLLSAGADVLDVVIARYARQRNTGSLSHLRIRAALYHELEVARWLLHGIEMHDQSVVDDAIAMLDRMVGTSGALGSALTAADSRSPLGEAEVSALLDETPEVVDHLTETAAYEALDEDRMFGVDTDFIEPLEPDEAPADGAASTRTDSEGGDADDHPTAALDDQLTAPVDDDELPGRSR